MTKFVFELDLTENGDAFCKEFDKWIHDKSFIKTTDWGVPKEYDDWIKSIEISNKQIKNHSKTEVDPRSLDVFATMLFEVLQKAVDEVGTAAFCGTYTVGPNSEGDYDECNVECFEDSVEMESAMVPDPSSLYS